MYIYAQHTYAALENNKLFNLINKWCSWRARGWQCAPLPRAQKKNPPPIDSSKHTSHIYSRARAATPKGEGIYILYMDMWRNARITTLGANARRWSPRRTICRAPARLHRRPIAQMREFICIYVHVVLIHYRYDVEKFLVHQLYGIVLLRNIWEFRYMGASPAQYPYMFWAHLMVFAVENWKYVYKTCCSFVWSWTNIRYYICEII